MAGFFEKFCSVYVVKGVWSLLTDLQFNRLKPTALPPSPSIVYPLKYRAASMVVTTA